MDLSKPEQPTERYCGSCKSFFASEAFDWLCSGCFKYTIALWRNKKNEEDKRSVVGENFETPKKEITSA